MIFRKRTEILSGHLTETIAGRFGPNKMLSGVQWRTVAYRDLGCVLGLNLYRALGSRDKNDCAAAVADGDDISIASCNTHKIYM
jgi:hypothetical protein